MVNGFTRTANPFLIGRARELRKKLTRAEARLWRAIRREAFRGFHFRRQQPLVGFIPDFYCHAARLVVEVDGKIHRFQREYDRQRDAKIGEHGVRIIRFTNEEVFWALPRVLKRIHKALREGSAEVPRQRARFSSSSHTAPVPVGCVEE